MGKSSSHVTYPPRFLHWPVQSRTLEIDGAFKIDSAAPTTTPSDEANLQTTRTPPTTHSRCRREGETMPIESLSEIAVQY